MRISNENISNQNDSNSDSILMKLTVNMIKLIYKKILV